MEFRAVTARTTPGVRLTEPVASPSREEAVSTIVENLLKHIPIEASGFYMTSLKFLRNLELPSLAVIAILALILLVVVRWAAGASRAVMYSTIGAFVLWMLVLDQGVLHQAFPALVSNGMDAVLALFYSGIITALASTGKIK